MVANKSSLLAVLIHTSLYPGIE